MSSSDESDVFDISQAIQQSDIRPYMYEPLKETTSAPSTRQSESSSDSDHDDDDDDDDGDAGDQRSDNTDWFVL